MSEPSMGTTAQADEVEGVVVRGTATGFAQEILVGPCWMTADQPKAVGGTKHQRRCRQHLERFKNVAWGRNSGQETKYPPRCSGSRPAGPRLAQESPTGGPRYLS